MAIALRTNARNVRNSYVTVQAGNGRPVSTGPISASGGVEIVIQQREFGDISPDVVRITQTVDGGEVILRVYDENGRIVFTRTTTR